MKNPLIFLFTAIMFAGCSSSSPFATENPRDQLPQSEQEYLESVNSLVEREFQINQKALDSLDISQCEKLDSENAKIACANQVIMSMAASGDSSLCDQLADEQDKEICTR